MNIVRKISQTHSYYEITERIRATTGANYSVGHIGNVARGYRAVNFKLLYSLERAFPDFFVPEHQPANENGLTEKVES